MAYLYQEINKVPGLTGSSYERQKQLYQRLGSPLGNYTGSYQQNIWLLQQIAKGNYGTQQTTPEPTTPAVDPTQEVVNEVGGDEVSKGPVFGEVLPYDEAWGNLKPYFQQQAEWEINPEQRRLLNNALRSYSMSLAGTGGGRFGFNDRGSIEAENARNTKAMTQDWLANQENAFKTLWYDPTEKAYNTGLETGSNPSEPVVPTFDQWKSEHGSGWSTPDSSNQYLAPVYGSNMTGWGTAPQPFRGISEGSVGPSMPTIKPYTQSALSNFNKIYNQGISF